MYKNKNYCNIHDLEYFHDMANSSLFNNEQCGLVQQQAIAALQQAILLYEQSLALHKQSTKDIQTAFSWLEKCGSNYDCNAFTPKCEQMAQNLGLMGEQIIQNESNNIIKAKEVLEEWVNTSDEVDDFNQLISQYIKCVHSQNNNCNCNKNNS